MWSWCWYWDWCALFLPFLFKDRRRGPTTLKGCSCGLWQPLRVVVEWEGFPEGEVNLCLNMTLLYHQIRQQMEEQVAQKSCELEQYLQRVQELEDMYLKLQEALEDERQARQDEETVRKLQARCWIRVHAAPSHMVAGGDSHCWWEGAVCQIGETWGAWLAVLFILSLGHGRALLLGLKIDLYLF